MAKKTDATKPAEITVEQQRLVTQNAIPQINISKRNVNVDNGEIITIDFLAEVVKKYDGGKYITIKGYFNIEDNPGSIYFVDILNFMAGKGYEFISVLSSTDNRFVYGEILFKKV